MRKLLISFIIIIPLVCVFRLFNGNVNTNSAPVRKDKQPAENKTEALNPLQFLSMSRAFPNADIPPRAYADAYNFYKTHFTGTPASARTTGASPTWNSIGPDNIGGRGSGFAIDPEDTNVIWLGSASGGLWKSTTGGIGKNAWAYIPTGYPVRGVSAITINPNNSNELFIGTGETYDYGTSFNGLVTRPTRGSNGIGILKTTNGGLTWTKSLDWTYNQERGVWDIVYNPMNPKVIYAATTEGIFKTTDGGATWNLSLNKLMVMNLVINKTDTATLLAGVGNLSSAGKGIYKTTNGGTTWNLITSGLPPYTNQGRITLAMYPKNNNLVMALIADIYSTVGVYRSTDGGDHWSAVNTSTEIVSYQGWYAKGLIMKSDDSSRMMFAGVDLFASSNAGSTITDVNSNGYHSDIHGIFSNPYKSNQLYILTDGGLFRSNDFGSTYYECTSGYATTQFYIGSVSTTDSALALGGVQDNYSDQYTGNVDWTPVVGGDGTFSAIDPTNDSYQYAAYQYLNLYRSTDRGQNFTQIVSEPSDPTGNNPAAFVAPFVLCPSAPHTLYAGVQHLSVSQNRGSAWIHVGPTPVDNNNYIITIGADPKDSNDVYFGTAPTDSFPMHVFRGNASANTVTDITGSLPNRYPRDIAVSTRSSNEVYIAFSGFGSGHIFKSLNGGTSWTDISATLPDVPFHCITIDPARPDTLFAGSDLGVFISPDDGNSWFAFNDGLPDGVLVFDIAYSPADQSIVAFTHGNGAYKAYLNLLSVGVSAQVNDFTNANIYPCPAHDVLNVETDSKINAPVSYEIFDAQGRLVKTHADELHAGKNISQIDISRLSQGTYYLNFISGSRSVIKKFIVI